MREMPIRWKVKPLLDAHGVESNYRFWKDSQLSRVTAYAIADGTHEALDVGVLDKLLPYLQKLTGKALQIGDVVEWVRMPERELKTKARVHLGSQGNS